jgi:hypothetical protein
MDLILDDLLRLAAYRNEAGAERFVPARNLLQRPLQHLEIQLPSNP